MIGRNLKVLLSEATIQNRVRALGLEIAAGYPGDDPLYLVCVLKGSCVFLADLARAIPRPVRIDFVSASSYGSETVSSGEVTLTKDVASDVGGADVLIVEDIVDTGATLAFLRDHLARKQPRSLRVVSLLDKPERRSQEVTIDYAGFTVPDEFVVGYGLDFDEAYRNLRDVCVLES